ncbi:pH regulation protein F [Alkalilimnicola ehrlichii]|uniref:pH regulation protein F n=1 Tax=Alkalilimnicola ehrlichii TaxID=351052 RepID=A0A3E0WY75_9GAMM|nr:cation:proton antiporter [Alkalilimnicola ehrlichii]RFA30360.1 pH regulation protein F [Alkalilimnicola ehrlichii]RFA37932.1 pH regulation protein F [Alkalilimnicola ehrlichii]
MFELTIQISFIILGLALLLSFIRLVKGPTLPDRVVALELVASLTVGVIALYTVATGVADFLDVAIVLALTAFLAAVGFARYLEKGGPRDD